MIIPAYFEDPLIQSENTLPNRAYFIPASNRLDDPVERRERSDRFQLLNGDWKFRWYPSIHHLTEQFHEEHFDPSGCDTIPVPGVWQNHGYDRHQCTNIHYPFPADPPFVPQGHHGAHPALCPAPYDDTRQAEKGASNDKQRNDSFYQKAYVCSGKQYAKGEEYARL